MAGPSYHARTHSPGGTDPIQFPPASGLSFAVIEGVGVSLLSDPGVVQTLTGLSSTYTNDAATFDVTGTADAIIINQTGWYKVDAALDHADSMPGLDGFWAQYSDAAANDVLLAMATNINLGAGTFVRQSFHLYHIFEAGLALTLRAIVSADTTVALAAMTVAVYKVA
jgi:hypothetical protein